MASSNPPLSNLCLQADNHLLPYHVFLPAGCPTVECVSATNTRTSYVAVRLSMYQGEYFSDTRQPQFISSQSPLPLFPYAVVALLVMQCPSGTNYVSGGCSFDQGALRNARPATGPSGDFSANPDGFFCETTANQPITAYACCCTGEVDGGEKGRRHKTSVPPKKPTK